MQVRASQLPFLADSNAEMAVPPSLWHKNRRTCRTVEWSYCLFTILGHTLDSRLVYKSMKANDAVLDNCLVD